MNQKSYDDPEYERHELDVMKAAIECAAEIGKAQQRMENKNKLLKECEYALNEVALFLRVVTVPKTAEEDLPALRTRIDLLESTLGDVRKAVKDFEEECDICDCECKR